MAKTKDASSSGRDIDALLHRFFQGVSDGLQPGSLAGFSFNSESSESSESSETSENSEDSESSENSERTEDLAFLRTLLAVDPAPDEWGGIAQIARQVTGQIREG